MHDIRINLLPWRDEQREQKKQEFLQILIMFLAVAGAIILGVDRFYNNAIETQKSRNAFLQGEVQVLEDRIAEINLLQQNRNQLLARMRVIQDLQGNRPIIVRVFDEMARQLADRVFYSSIEMKGQQIDIQGIAESNNRISAQLRHFSDSDWFNEPNVSAITADGGWGPQASRFTLTVKQTTPDKAGE